MSQTKVLPCSCTNPTQDSYHGKGNRVHNYAPKQQGYRCTCCGNIKKRDR